MIIIFRPINCIVLVKSDVRFHQPVSDAISILNLFCYMSLPTSFAFDFPAVFIYPFLHLNDFLLVKIFVLSVILAKLSYAISHVTSKFHQLNTIYVWALCFLFLFKLTFSFKIITFLSIRLSSVIQTAPQLQMPK